MECSIISTITDRYISSSKSTLSLWPKNDSIDRMTWASGFLLRCGIYRIDCRFLTFTLILRSMVKLVQIWIHLDICKWNLDCYFYERIYSVQCILNKYFRRFPSHLEIGDKNSSVFIFLRQDPHSYYVSKTFYHFSWRHKNFIDCSSRSDAPKATSSKFMT